MKVTMGDSSTEKAPLMEQFVAAYNYVEAVNDLPPTYTAEADLGVDGAEEILSETLNRGYD